MRSMLLAAMAAVWLAACSTPQQCAVQQRADIDRMIIEFGPACTRLGYTPNADPWRNCVIQLNLNDHIDRYGASNEFYGGWGGRGHWGGGGWWGR